MFRSCGTISSLQALHANVAARIIQTTMRQAIRVVPAFQQQSTLRAIHTSNAVGEPATAGSASSSSTSSSNTASSSSHAAKTPKSSAANTNNAKSKQPTTATTTPAPSASASSNAKSKPNDNTKSNTTNLAAAPTASSAIAAASSSAPSTATSSSSSSSTRPRRPSSSSVSSARRAGSAVIVARATTNASTGGMSPQLQPIRLSRRQRKLANASAKNLQNEPTVVPADAVGAVPKQKLAMYTKLLRVIRSPVKGDAPNTRGDDYVLDSSEALPASHQSFTGLITANLSGPGKRGKGKKSGKETGRSYGKGGRKSARAQVWIQKAIKKGTGDFYVNGTRYVEYFTELDHRWELCAPFFYTRTLTDFDMIAVVQGGGRSGQAGAIKHAAAKALQAYDRARYRPMLKRKFLLSRDARVVERKKYGQKKARKRFTFVKR